MRRLLVVALMVGGCAGAGVGGVDVPWTRNAAYTTCTQWMNEMTPPQRMTMAAQMLRILRPSVDTAAPERPDLVPPFVDAIGAACRGQHEGVVDEKWTVVAASTLAFINDDRFKP